MYGIGAAYRPRGRTRYAVAVNDEHRTLFAERWERFTSVQRAVRMVWAVPSLFLIVIFLWAAIGDEPSWVRSWLLPLAWIVVLGNLALWAWGRAGRAVRASVEDVR